jgi:hypothetical protein
MTLKSIFGQSLMDLCSMAYGTGVDNLVKFANDNAIPDLNYKPQTPQNFTYDSNLTTDTRIINYVFVTASNDMFYVPESGIGYYVTEDATKIYSAS